MDLVHDIDVTRDQELLFKEVTNWPQEVKIASPPPGELQSNKSHFKWISVKASFPPS